MYQTSVRGHRQGGRCDKLEDEGGRQEFISRRVRSTEYQHRTMPDHEKVGGRAGAGRYDSGHTGMSSDQGGWGWTWGERLVAVIGR